jgi:hypothetical protein
MNVKVHNIWVNDHIVCATMRPHVADIVSNMLVDAAKRGHLPDCDDHRVPAPKIKRDVLRMEWPDADHVCYMVPIRFPALRHTSDTGKMVDAFQREPIYRTNITINLADSLAEVARVIRENLSEKS